MKNIIIVMMLMFVGVCASAQTIPSSAEVENMIRNRQIAEAKVALQSVLAVKPNSVKANYYMAQIMEMEGGDPKPYLAIYLPYKEKKDAEEAIRVKEGAKIFLYTVGGMMVMLLASLGYITFLQPYLEDRKRLKVKEERERVKAQQLMEEKRKLLKSVLAFNEELKNELFNSADGEEQRRLALDAIAALSKECDVNLHDIRTWMINVKYYIRTAYRLNDVEIDDDGILGYGATV